LKRDNADGIDRLLQTEDQGYQFGITKLLM
jgi:hypothetical protein